MSLFPGERPLAMGCMRLSTEADRDPARAAAVLQTALDAGVTLLDTADAYAQDEAEIGHNERLIAEALATWSGDRGRITVATKGGLTRPGGRWVPDGRARHLRAAADASRRALGVARLDLYQLHAPDPRTALHTSVRALEALRRDGVVGALGLCNVSVRQVEEARAVAEIASVQVEISPFEEESVRGGVAEHCIENGIRLLAYRPLGGRKRRGQIERDPVLGGLAARHAATPFEIVLAWLEDLSPLVVALPGPTREETARSIARARRIELGDDDRARLDERFPMGRLLRTRRSSRRPSVRRATPVDHARRAEVVASDGGALAEVVIVMGLPGAGKTTLALDLVSQGYVRLNRDEAGGRLVDLLPALERTLASGRKRVVLDNTYASRSARNAVIEKAWEHGVDVRCVFLDTGLEQAQVNAVRRLLARYGRLLDPAELAAAGKTDPGAFGPLVQMRHERGFDPPDPGEGFVRIDRVAFVRQGDPSWDRRAVILWLDGVVRGSRSGRRAPTSADDVVLLPGRAEVLQGYHREGWALLGLAWYPEVSAGAVSAEEVEAASRRTEELLGAPLAIRWCPHEAGPPFCWCRKPLPGLGLLAIEHERLDPARSLYVGVDASDRGLARRLGLGFREASAFFGVV